MKLRLFIFVLFAFLSLVAYQKYSEYSALKSISSYDSCIAAKESVIQESYPATCITRLGSRFTESIDQKNKDTSHWKTYVHSNQSFSFKYPSDFTNVENTVIPNSSHFQNKAYYFFIKVSDFADYEVWIDKIRKKLTINDSSVTYELISGREVFSESREFSNTSHERNILILDNDHILHLSIVVDMSKISPEINYGSVEDFSNKILSTFQIY